MEKITRREAIQRVGILLGGAVSAPTIAGVLGGCQPDQTADWTPSTLSSDQNELVTVISEHIMPETDTPGARTAQVNRFIDKLLTEWHPSSHRNHFLEGLDEVDARCQDEYGSAFLECTDEEQVAVLTALDEEAYAEMEEEEETEIEEEREPEEGQDTERTGRREAEEGASQEETPQEEDPQEEIPSEEEDVGPPPPFFRMMKEMTLTGYYTSEIGMTEELVYNNDIIPGEHIGCLPLEESRGETGVGDYWQPGERTEQTAAE